MSSALLANEAANGGFPEPVEGEPVRVVAARHAGCGEATRVRLPRAIPARVVRRVTCVRCSEPFEAAQVREILRIPFAGPISLPNLPSLPPLPSLPSIPALERLPKIDTSSRGWRVASVPIAAAVVIGGLLVIQGGGDDSGSLSPDAPRSAASAPPASGKDGERPAGEAKLVQGSTYSLALPAGWTKIDPPAGATFAATAPGAAADATLWIEEKPELDFPTFVSQSLRQVEAFAGSARVVERIPAPTVDDTAVRIAADPPPGQPTYEVLLRAVGPYRYYLATSIQPDAPAAALDGAELIGTSFTPQGSR